MNREGKIAKRTLIGLVMLAFVIVFAISTAITVQVRQELEKKYTDFAFSYVNAAADYIDGDTINQYLKTGKTDEYYDEIAHYLQASVDSTAEKEEEENADGKMQIKYLYVFVPGEGDDYIYVWDAEEFSDENAELLETYPFSEGAKEQALRIMNKEIKSDKKRYTDSESKEEMLTVSVGIPDSKGNIVAVVAVDLLVNDIQNVSMKVIISVIVSVIGIMALAIIAYYQIMRKRIVDPIVTLHKATEDIVEHIDSDKELVIDIKTDDELEMLADSFVEMNKKLKEYIKQNELITSEKERIGAELSIASTIQDNSIPNLFPAFPERKEFDIYASMTPAKEVGGDFYNFFLVDDDHLAVVMADVSGKGIPAALFMMVSNILISDRTHLGGTPAEILESVNDSICASNEADMFVTVWLGILEISTGKMIAANAGHDDPAVCRKNGDFEIVKNRHGIVIGAMEGVHYQNFEIQLEKGDKFFLYTDGLPEATDKNEKMLTLDGMLIALNKNKEKNPKGILDGVNECVNEFVGDAPQFDDLTMLSLELIEVDENNSDKTLTVDADNDNLDEVMGFVDSFLEEKGASMKTQMQVDLAVEEIFVNIANYAYGDGTGNAEISVSENGGEVSIVFKDSGVPYNPLEKEDPDITLSAEEREIGGLGVFLTKKNMDTVKYEFRDGFNILTMTKSINQ